MRNALILTDRPAEHAALIRVQSCFRQCRLTKANCLYSKKNALRVQTVKQVFEALPFFTDQVFFWNLVTVKEQHVTFDRLTPHFRDWRRASLHLIEIGVEQGQTKIRLRALILWRCTRDDQDFVCALCARRPDFTAVQLIIAVWLLLCFGLKV